MLYVFYGNDVQAVRKAAFDAVAKLVAGKTIDRIDAETYTPGILSDIAGASSLFGGSGAYLIDTASDNTDFFSDTIAHLEAFSQSPNTFVIIESNLLAPEKKKFAKFATTIEEFKKSATERFNAFTMADSLLKKDKRMLWVQYQEAKSSGLAAEEIIGTLWWQLKTLRLAALTSSASEAGMKDFPYNKAKRALGNFKTEYLIEISNSLLRLYHDGHRGKTDIDLALEKWVLSI